MRKNVLIPIFEQRLAQLGCPADVVNRSARELADHYEDLKADGVGEGLSDDQAEARAAERLGDPRALAERLAGALRRSTWWGRHPVLGFFVLPSMGIPLLMACVPLLTLALLKGALPANVWLSLVNGGAGYGLLATLLHTTFYGSLLALTILVCRLARRAAVGLKWTLMACFLCSAHAAFTNMWVHPHSLSIGYLLHPNWICAAIPLSCALVVVARQWHADGKLTVALLMAALFLAPCARADEKSVLQRGWIGGEYKVDRPWSPRQFFSPRPEVLYDRSFPGPVRNSQKAAIKVTTLGTNTPAALAGLREGDLILEVNHQAVTRLGDFRRRIDESKPGAIVALTVYRDGQMMEVSAQVGQETVRRHAGTVVIGFPPFVHEWRLIPDDGFSVVFAGWELPHELRHDLGGQKELFEPSWRVWLGIFDFSLGKRVISQTNATASPATSKAAMARL
jgi:hypothetical protein